MALRPECTLHWGLTTLKEHGAALGESSRESAALEHSALGSTPHGPEVTSFQQAQAPRGAARMCPKASAPPRESQAQTDTSTFSITTCQMTSMKETI